VPELVPGVYEQLVTARLSDALRAVDPELIEREGLDPADAHVVLARHLGALAQRALRSVGGSEDHTRLIRQVALANAVAEAIAAAAPDADLADQLVAESRDVLRAVVEHAGVPGPIQFPQRPETPLAASALLVNGRDQPRIGSEVQRELASADRVDLLCAFIKWHGLRVLEEPLQELLRRGGQLRVITTTYIGATERRAVDRLVEMGADVRVSYETRTTRLHATAWLFDRRTGFSTAYVGSSNVSKTALLDGLEWNVRMSAVEQPHLLDTFSATFEQYWPDPSFEEYVPARDHGRLDAALAAERGGPADLPLEITTLDVQPWSYQREILDTLAAEREVHGRRRNLVVMATGTGKTVVAALDYRRLHAHHCVDF
jgi:HKD family nuclease